MRIVYKTFLCLFTRGCAPCSRLAFPICGGLLPRHSVPGIDHIGADPQPDATTFSQRIRFRASDVACAD